MSLSGRNKQGRRVNGAPTKEERQLLEEWTALVARNKRPLERGALAKGETNLLEKLSSQPKVKALEAPSTSKLKSLITPGGSTAPAVRRVYSGTKVLGIAVMHKSNAVPVFSEEEAVSVAQMRRN